MIKFNSMTWVKNAIRNFRPLLFLVAAMMVVTGVMGQSNPVAQSLPYNQDFSALGAASTTYPAGWQGWNANAAGLAGTTASTAAPVADLALTAPANASQTAGGVKNYNGKIGILSNAGSVDAAMALAINTTGVSNVSVVFDAMVIRNPYDGTITRINEMVLQYRVGTTGTFTNVAYTEYQNNTTTQTTAVTTPLNSVTKAVYLPAACNNQAVVQLRWIYRDVSGTGARASFAVDNIKIKGGYCAATFPSNVEPITSVVFAGINNTTSATLNGTPALENFTYLTGSVIKGQTYTITVKGNTDGSFTDNFRLYADLNQNGVFTDAGESVDIGTINTSTGVDTKTASTSVTVPLTAATGLTTIRITKKFSGYTTDPCNNAGYGQAEDYTINVIAPPNCSGAPAANSATASLSTACYSSNISLNLTTPNTDLGISYQWQSSPDNVTYTNITGATTVPYTATGQLAATWYRCIISCSFSGQSTASAPIQVSQTALASCYCIPSSTCTADRITDFQLNSLVNTSGTACSTSPAGYTLYATTPANQTTALAQGASYTATIATVAGNANGTGVAIWIDYNDNGVFDVSERSDNGATKFASNTTGTITVNVPAAAPLGNHRMRVTAMRNSLSNAQDPCTPANANGETEDYTITIATQASCSGTPTAGTTSASGNNICSPAAFNLSLSGATADANITYQWQSSTNNVTYTDITGATSSTYAASGITASNWYQCVLTCTNSGLSATSTPVQINVVQCINMSDGNISTCAANFYDSQGPTVNYLNNENHTYTIYPSPGNVLRVVFSAFNTESGFDFLYIYNGNSISSPLVGTYSGTTSPGTITSSAADGSLTFRFTSDVSNRAAGWQSVLSCVPLPACTGTVTGGTTVASANAICAGNTVTVSLSGQTTGASAITYQWQSSTDNVTYSNISGANGVTYTSTVASTIFYQCLITCTASGSSATSDPVQVNVNPFYNCYCEPSYGNSCSSDYISNVTFGTINNTTTCSGTTPGNLTTYNTPNPGFIKGNTYPLSVTTDGDVEGLNVWIDYNMNGVFDATESVMAAAAGGPPQTTTANILIPTGAPTGITKMRVRCRYNNTVANTAACTAYGTGYGETEDYLITIQSNTCLGAPTYPANGGNGCTSPSGVQLAWPGFPGATQYDVYFGTTNPPTTLVSDNQSALTYDAGNLTSGTFYWSVVPQVPGATTCSVWSFTMVDAPELVVTTPILACENTSINFTADNNAAGQSSGNAYAWSGPNSFTSTSQNPTIGSATQGDAGTYSVTITNQFLCTATTTVDVMVNPNPVLVQDSVQDVSCFGLNDGIAYLSASAGTPIYTYTDFVISNNSGVFTDLAPGSYTFYASDDNGCSSQPLNVSITEPVVLAVNPSSNGPICKGSTLELVSAPAGGTLPYSFQWNGPGGFTSTNQDVSFANGLDGVYTVTVTDAHGCTATNTVDAQVDDAPTVNAGADIALCSPATAQLAGSIGGSATSSTWTTNGDGTFDNVSLLNAVYTPGANDVVAGTVTLTLTTNDPVGVCDAVSDNLTVSISAGLPADPGSVTGHPGIICPPVTGLNLTVPPVAGATTYSWYLGPGTGGVTFTTPTNTNSVTVDIVAASNSTYSIRVVGVNACGSSVNYSSAFIRRSVSTPSSITGPGFACSGDTKTYIASPVQSATSYVWTGPAGALFDGQPSPYTANDLSVDVTFATAGGTVCVASQVGCFTSAPKCISVGATPPQPGAITGSFNVCPGQQNVAYSVPNIPGAAFNWVAPNNASIDLGQGTNSVTVDFTSNFSVGNINVTAVSVCGTSTLRQTTIVGNGSTGTTVSRPNSITGATDALCGTTQTYTANPLVSAASYSWTFPSGTIINSQSANTINVTFPSSGFNNTSIGVTAQVGCNISLPRTIAIKGAPKESAITGSAVVCANTGGYVYSVVPRPGLSYAWAVPSGATITSGAGTNSVTVQFGVKTGQISCTVYNACGSGAKTLAITFNCRQSQASENVAQELNFSAYPNPASDKLNIVFTAKQKGNSTIQLMDLTGKTIMLQSIATAEGESTHTLDISTVAKGVYILNVITPEGNMQSKVVIE